MKLFFLSEDVDIILKKTLKVAYLLYLNENGKIKRVFNPPQKAQNILIYLNLLGFPTKKLGLCALVV